MGGLLEGDSLFFVFLSIYWFLYYCDMLSKASSITAVSSDPHTDVFPTLHQLDKFKIRAVMWEMRG